VWSLKPAQAASSNPPRSWILSDAKLPPEHAALLLCARQEFSPEHQRALTALCSGSGLDWSALFELSSIHKISGLVHDHLKTCHAAGLVVPPEIDQDFPERRRDTSRRKEAWFQNVRRAASICDGIGRRVLLVKGIALDAVVYTDSSATTYNDIDLVVDAKSYGVEPHLRDELHWLGEASEFEIDYYSHHDVTMDEVLSIDFDRVWADAKPVSFRGIDAFVMAPEDLVITGCVGACRKRFELKKLCDVAEIIATQRDLAWPLLLEKALAYRCGNLVYAGLSAARWVLGCDIPSGILDRLGVSRLRRKTFDALLHKLFTLDPESSWNLELWNRELDATVILPYASYDWRTVWRRMNFLPTSVTNTEPHPNTEPHFKAQLEEGRRLGLVERPRPAADVRLHLLGDAGILFAERAQDLYVLNAAAAFVWSCLEDGLEREQIVAAVEEAAGMPTAAAAVQLGSLWRQWEELGLLAGTARNRGGRRRHGEEREDESGAAEQPGDAPPFCSERGYRLLATSFRVRYATALQEEAVHPVLAHLEAAAAEPMTAVNLLWDGAGHLLVVDGRRKERCGPIEELAPLVKGALLAHAVNGYPYLLYVHAGVVRNGHGCVLLPAAPGSGKTSLTAALIRAGFAYLSDEVALLEAGTLRVRPVPVSLCVKEGAWDLLAPLYPELRGLAVHRRWDSKRVRYLNPPADALDPEPEVSHPVRWIVFPRYAPGAQTALRPLRRADALHRLLEQCLAMPAPLDHAKLDALVRWIGGVPCYELVTSSLDEAVALVDGLCRSDSRALDCAT
jgi:hypothetical protein